MGGRGSYAAKRKEGNALNAKRRGKALAAKQAKDIHTKASIGGGSEPVNPTFEGYLKQHPELAAAIKDIVKRLKGDLALHTTLTDKLAKATNASDRIHYKKSASVVTKRITKLQDELRKILPGVKTAGKPAQ